MGRTWRVTVHGVRKSWTQLSDFHFTKLPWLTSEMANDCLMAAEPKLCNSRDWLIAWIKELLKNRVKLKWMILKSCLNTLFTVAKTQKQTKCSLTEEWIKKMWYIYNRILLSLRKQNNATSRNMDTARDDCTKRSKRKMNIWYHLYVDLYYYTEELINETEIDSQT